MRVLRGGFAPAGATRGLCDRPLDCFAPPSKFVGLYRSKFRWCPLRPQAAIQSYNMGVGRRRSPEGDRRLRLFPLPSGTRGKDQYHRKRQPHPLRPIVRAGDFLFFPQRQKNTLDSRESRANRNPAATYPPGPCPAKYFQHWRA